MVIINIFTTRYSPSILRAAFPILIATRFTPFLGKAMEDLPHMETHAPRAAWIMDPASLSLATSID